ncbi:hypothetical protein SAMN02745866_01744 [Alteromonadaceae bacterium Bs31]|nr:hypothetical protein SAMN02745866_01744 [Alteromonadaceae bacterium Bs31]
MKKWFVCLLISVIICVLGLIYFIRTKVITVCVESGGLWLGLLEGCENGGGISMQYFGSPLAVIIFFAIVLGVSSVLVQVHSMLFKVALKKTRRGGRQG